jgi:putative peptidoglycan lipid II flippase
MPEPPTKEGASPEGQGQGADQGQKPEAGQPAGQAGQGAGQGAGTTRRMAGAALLLSLATLLSRVLGLVREQVFAALLGAGFFGDAFTMAFRLPNLLRDLFAEGALSAAFQPAFQSAKKLDGQAAAQHLANLVLTFLLVVVGTLVLLGMILSPQMVGLWAEGFSQVAGKAELTTL